MRRGAKGDKAVQALKMGVAEELAFEVDLAVNAGERDILGVAVEENVSGDLGRGEGRVVMTDLGG